MEAWMPNWHSSFHLELGQKYRSPKNTVKQKIRVIILLLKIRESTIYWRIKDNSKKHYSGGTVWKIIQWARLWHFLTGKKETVFATVVHCESCENDDNESDEMKLDDQDQGLTNSVADNLSTMLRAFTQRQVFGQVEGRIKSYLL